MSTSFLLCNVLQVWISLMFYTCNVFCTLSLALSEQVMCYIWDFLSCKGQRMHMTIILLQ